VPRITNKNQITPPVSVLAQTGLEAGDQVIIEAPDNGVRRVSRDETTFDTAFGALTGAYPPGYLEQLDAKDKER
jgi:bifunctional DNA-binding transcriptional regulator/antitoxin component of YhaV-PrlF toxin-antitoxin module